MDPYFIMNHILCNEMKNSVCLECLVTDAGAAREVARKASVAVLGMAVALS